MLSRAKAPGDQRTRVVDPLTIAAVTGTCPLLGAWGSQAITSRRERWKARRDSTARDREALEKDIDEFCTKAVEWWSLPAKDPKIAIGRPFVVARSHRLGQDLQRLIEGNQNFEEAINSLAALRDAAT